MPGIIAFRRRWSVGSDDLVVPGLFLFFIHLIWLVVLSVILTVIEFDKEVECVSFLWQHMIGYFIVIVVSLLLELMISLTALRGSILDTEQRKAIPGLIYVRLVVFTVEMVWLVIGGMWLVRYYKDCPVSTAKDALLGLVICSWFVILSFFITLWCTFDPAGRSWVKMMNYQRSMKESESKFQYRRSGSCTRTWRQRKVLRAYQNSWDQRCRLLFCCMPRSDKSQNSFGDIARLLSDFFRDIDVVPSDVIAGLILLRKYQKIERESIVKQRLNDTYEFLSGVPVTSGTQFLPLNDPVYYAFFQDVIHYMTFALGAYGWPMYAMNNPSATLCQLCVKLRCSCFPCCRSSKGNVATIIRDNCCQCNYAALKQQVETKDVEIVYATFHVDVGITPFFVAVDYARKKIIVSIRGTLSLQDVITDLNAEGEPIPINPPREDWLGHKGMIQVAVHIQNKLLEESILQQAFHFNPQRGTENFKLVIVGHSLGAGSAAILSILLRQLYPDVVCFSYSPPGGTLSMPAAEYTKSFITSVVVGKDVVPRIGLHQMESLRADLMHAINRSKDPKWKTISCSVFCCGCAGLPTSAQELRADGSMQLQYKIEKDKARELVFHSQTSNVALTSHQPLYPPGRIIHVVRHHTTRREERYESKWRQVLRKRKPVYQALWANNTDFDEVLISPVMIQDHMPDNVLAALNKVIENPKERTLNHSKQMAVAISQVTTTSPLRMATSKPPEYVTVFERLFFDELARPEPRHCDGCHVRLSRECEGENGEPPGWECPEDVPPFRNGKILNDTRARSKQSRRKRCLLSAEQQRGWGCRDVFELWTWECVGSLWTSSAQTLSEADFGLRIKKVITTVGPRKPQRTAAFTNSAIESECQIDFESSGLLDAYPAHSSKQNTPAHKLQLETSFPSLASPNEKTTCKISLQSFGSHSSNNTNTITTNSLLKNESLSSRQIKPEVHTPPSKRFIPWEYQSMLDDQTCERSAGNGKLDLIHDDWLGLAPLATPESLSEVSSISSRASSVIVHHADKGKERWVPSLTHRRMQSNGQKVSKESDGERGLRAPHPFRCKNYDNSDSSDSYLDSPPLNRNALNLKSIPSIDSQKSSSGESFLNYGINSPDHNVQNHRMQKTTTRIIRRTPKIPKDLARAYEDSYSNQRFEEMMKARNESRESTSNETNSYTSARSHELDKSSTDLYLTPVSSNSDSVRFRNDKFFTPEKILRNLENREKRGSEAARWPGARGAHRECESWLSELEEDINYHKPTTVILPTDENFPYHVPHLYQAPYLETDFSLSDPDLPLCEARRNRSDRKLKFEERVRSGVSFDQDYEFDIETESAKLIDSNNDSETSLYHPTGVQGQDFFYKDEDSIDETLRGDECFGREGPRLLNKSSQNLVRFSDVRAKDGKSHYSSRSAEALPLLANISQGYPEKRRKYSFSFLTVSRGESSV